MRGKTFIPEKIFKMTIYLEGQGFDADCVVLEDLPSGVLLGMPFLVAHGARLICQKNTDQTSTSYEI